MSTKERLYARKPKIDKVSIGDEVYYARAMNGTQRDLWEQMVTDGKKNSKNGHYPYYRASLVVRTACDEQGNLLFDDGEVVAVSDTIDSDTIDALYDLGATLSGVRKKDAEAAGKNSMSGQSEVSTST